MAVGKTSKFKIIFCLATIYFLGYAAYVIGRPFYRHSVLKTQLTQVSLLTELRMDQLREVVAEELSDSGIPLTEDKVIITKNDMGDISIRASWSEDIYFMGYYIMTHDFDINVGAAR